MISAIDLCRQLSTTACDRLSGRPKWPVDHQPLLGGGCPRRGTRSSIDGTHSRTAITIDVFHWRCAAGGCPSLSRSAAAQIGGVGARRGFCSPGTANLPLFVAFRRQRRYFIVVQHDSKRPLRRNENVRHEMLRDRATPPRMRPQSVQQRFRRSAVNRSRADMRARGELRVVPFFGARLTSNPRSIAPIAVPRTGSDHQPRARHRVIECLWLCRLQHLDMRTLCIVSSGSPTPASFFVFSSAPLSMVVEHEDPFMSRARGDLLVFGRHFLPVVEKGDRNPDIMSVSAFKSSELLLSACDASTIHKRHVVDVTRPIWRATVNRPFCARSPRRSTSSAATGVFGCAIWRLRGI